MPTALPKLLIKKYSLLNIKRHIYFLLSMKQNKTIQDVLFPNNKELYKFTIVFI